MPSPVSYVGNVATLTVNSVSIDNIKSLTAPSMSFGTVEATPLGSTSKQKLSTIFDGGEFSFDVFYDPTDTGHQSLTTMIGAATVVPIVLTVKPGTTAHTYSFNAIMTGWDVSGFEPEAVVTGSAKFTVTGAMTVS